MNNRPEVQIVVKRFPNAWSRRNVQAINGVSFASDRGETVSLVGVLGSGKTTRAAPAFSERVARREAPPGASPAGRDRV